MQSDRLRTCPTFQQQLQIRSALRLAQPQVGVVEDLGHLEFLPDVLADLGELKPKLASQRLVKPVFALPFEDGARHRLHHALSIRPARLGAQVRGRRPTVASPEGLGNERECA